MSGTTTIDQSGDLASVYIGGNVVIERDSGTPINDPVVVVFNTSVVNLDVGSTFTVRDDATLEIGGLVNINAGNSFIIGHDGTLDLGANVSVALLNDIAFASGQTGGVLVAEQGLNVNLLDNVSGFGFGDSIDFVGAGLALGYTDSFNGTSTDFTVALANGGTEDFALAGNLTSDNFLLLPDSSGGFTFTDTTCFAPGTRILTRDGEVRVEELAVGDVAVLADGSESAITFIGHRWLDLRRHPSPGAVRPVRIAPGALADGVPSRELVLSPDHALAIDGVLVQAKDLVDGIAVRQDFAVPAIRYYHVELAAHGILLAEGAPVESYLDTGHRGLFDNAAEPLILHPNLMQIRRQAESVAPLCMDGARLAAIRTRLQARKLAAGLAVSTDDAVSLRAGAVRVAPSRNAPGEIRFELPPGADTCDITVPDFVPADFDPVSNDRRRLGLALSAIALDSEMLPVEALVAPGGLHDRSAGDPHVWTRRQFSLRVPAGVRAVSLCVAGRPRCWRTAA